MLARCVPNRGSAMWTAPIVLHAFMTLAPGIQPATCSPADVECTRTRPERSGLSGFVASTTTLPRRSPASYRAVVVIDLREQRHENSPA